MILPSPKIVVVDDDREDLQAIVAGLSSLGTTAFGLYYSVELTELPRFPCLRILFLDLHLTGSGGLDQQIKSTIGVLTQLLTEDSGPYAVVLWSGHISEGFSRFQTEVGQRLPVLGLPLPLQILPLDKIDFIQTLDGRRLVGDPKRLEQQIMGQIEACPQLAALLSWEEDVSRATDDAIRQIFIIARQRSSTEPLSLANQVNRVLGELAVASVGRQNAEGNVFHAVNEVLVQVVADRLQHRSATLEVSQIWKQAVTEFRNKSDLNIEEAALLNSFLHIEYGSVLEKVQAHDRGSVLSLHHLLEQQFTALWGVNQDTLLKEFCLSRDYLTQNSASDIEWIMAQVQPACDQAQKNLGLLPFIIGLRISKFSRSKISEIKEKKCLWTTPPFKDTSEVYYLVFHLRFVAGLDPGNNLLKSSVRYRLRDPIMSELSHALHSYAGRPGIIRFPG